MFNLLKVTSRLSNKAQPVSASHRIVILDALRGFALLGIALANFPEFSLWAFLSEHERSFMPSYADDRLIRWAQYIFVDGKFYTIFSVLFGIGFFIIIDHAMQRGANGFRIFFRRMILLLLIGAAHLFFLWSGDILMLYAAVGLLLPLFRHCKPKTLLRWALFFFLLPVVIEIWRTLSGLNPTDALYKAWWSTANSVGINEDNFATWLRDADSLQSVGAFLWQGCVERMLEFVDGSRYFKVLALFLTGYYIGRQKLFHHLSSHRQLLVNVTRVGFFVGLPLSFVYAWSSMEGHPLGNIAHAVLYAVSVYPLGFAYMSGLCLIYLSHWRWPIWRLLAYPGRMALSCYILQSIIGIVLFYGIGFGMGGSVGLCQTELIAIAAFIAEVFLCALWLRYFRFGPLEWQWRMLTYGHWLPLRKDKENDI